MRGASTAYILKSIKASFSRLHIQHNTMASPLAATLLALVSCVANNIVQYTVLSLLALYSTLHVSRPLLPSARIDSLQRLITETADLLEKAHEERVFFSRDFNFNIHLRLSQWVPVIL